MQLNKAKEMDPRQLFVDERFLGCCVYCGANRETRDHVPSRVLLDDPLPNNLPVVECCAECNAGFSLDEEYVACFLDAVISGSVEPKGLQREKTRAALSHNPRLAERIGSSARVQEDGNTVWMPELERFSNVVLKLARGHIAYELSTPQLDSPTEISTVPLCLMSEDDRTEFEHVTSAQIFGWSEVGSRAFIRECKNLVNPASTGPWQVVQRGRYRYFVEGTKVMMVLSEYLACMVLWE